VKLTDAEQGSAAERVALVAGDLLLRANDLPLFGVDDLKRALVLGRGEPVTLDVQGKAGRRSFAVEPDPARRAA
jgi:S1-C subfamily serine protease